MCGCNGRGTVRLHDEWLNLGRVDCALVYNAAASPVIDLRPLLDDQLFLISRWMTRARAACAKPLRWRNVGYPLIIPSRPHAVRMTWKTRLGGRDRKYKVCTRSKAFPHRHLCASRHGSQCCR